MDRQHRFRVLAAWPDVGIRFPCPRAIPFARITFPALTRGCPWKYASLEAAPEINPQLTDDAKRILARTQWEADAARDYWIDTEHLLLGILGEKACPAEQYLTRASTLKSARRLVAENKVSRPRLRPGVSMVGAAIAA